MASILEVKINPNSITQLTVSDGAVSLKNMSASKVPTAFHSDMLPTEPMTSVLGTLPVAYHINP